MNHSLRRPRPRDTRLRPLIVAIAFLLAAAIGAQSALTGQWQGTTVNGTPVALDLVAKDTVITGTLTRAEETVQISDGRVTKTGFVFKARLGDETEALTGEFEGDRMRVWLDRQGPERAATFTRVKAKP